MSNIKLTVDGIKYISGGTTTTILNTDGEASGCVTTSSSNTFSDNIFVETSGNGVGIHKPGTSVTINSYTYNANGGFIGFKSNANPYNNKGIAVTDAIMFIWNHNGELYLNANSHITLRTASNIYFHSNSSIIKRKTYHIQYQ